MEIKKFLDGFGFTQEKATAREFAILLVIVLGIYGGLHRRMPPSPPLSLKAKLARTAVLREITEQQKEISKELTSQIPKWRTELKPFFSDRPKIQASIEDNLNQLATQDFDELKTDNIREIQRILTNLQKLLQANELFWTDEKKWWEIIFWSLFGTLCYLIQQTTDYYLKEKYQETIQGGQANTYLIRHKPKYYFFLLRSPFYSLIILFILNEASLEIVGISLSLASLGTPVLVALAFILGFANRVATLQLDMIIASIFKDAWQRSVRKIDIYPSTIVLKYGTSYDFQVVPDVKVKWSIWSQPLVGTIDTATGMYIAPPQQGYIYDQLGNLQKYNQDNLSIEEEVSAKQLVSEQQKVPIEQQVIIKAEREYEPTVSSLALVIFINDETKLIIYPEKTIIKYPPQPEQNKAAPKPEPQKISFYTQLIKPSIPGRQIPLSWSISTKEKIDVSKHGNFNYEKVEYTPPENFSGNITLEVKAAIPDYPETCAIAKVILQSSDNSDANKDSESSETQN